MLLKISWNSPLNTYAGVSEKIHAAGLKKRLRHVFSCQFCGILKNAIFFQMAAFVQQWAFILYLEKVN